jgi:alpha-N-arabinofuranosidase
MTARMHHVSTSGDDAAAGTCEHPFRTIQHAADLAMPGDTVRIHAGTYRERIDPPRGGTSDEARITYESAGDGVVEIKGSEIVSGWQPLVAGIWTLEVGNALFGDFNPYATTISGHWFYPKDRLHHPGAVFLDGHWLIEAASRDELLASPADQKLWFAEVRPDVTVFTARFGGVDPREHLIEITVRQTVFYPSREQRNFLTIRGLSLLHAATPWSPPTTEQIGLLGCHWAKGWIIEDCIVRYSACAGITLGKYHDPEDFPDRPVVERTDGEDTYHGTIRRALAHGWDLDTVGSHIVRRNTVSHCEMAGICGSLGAPRSVIEENVVHDIHVHCLFNGFEQAGIKFHGAIDSLIARNRIFRCKRGIWLDWMSQGARVTGNLCYDNGPSEDLFLEVNHGPFVVDNNAFLSPNSIQAMSSGGAYIGNVFLGLFKAAAEPTRTTPFFAPHSTRITGWHHIVLGDDRLLYNVFAEASGTTSYDAAPQPVIMTGNLYVNGARPSRFDSSARHSDVGQVTVAVEEDRIHSDGLPRPSFPDLGSEELGTPLLTGLPYVDARGNYLVLRPTLPLAG